MYKSLRFGLAVTPKTRIPEVFDSNICQDTSYNYSRFPWFSSALPEKCRIVLDEARAVSFHILTSSSFIHHITIRRYMLWSEYWQRENKRKIINLWKITQTGPKDGECVCVCVRACVCVCVGGGDAKESLTIIIFLQILGFHVTRIFVE
jgi:hypothetical protein